MRSPVFVLSILLFACGAPARLASGEVLDSVAWQEHFARTMDVRDTSLTGKDLVKAIPLLDQSQVAQLSGEFVAAGQVDEASVVFTLRVHDRPERTIVMKNCAEKRVCAFLTAASKDGLVEKLPALCRRAGPCTGE